MKRKIVPGMTKKLPTKPELSREDKSKYRRWTEFEDSVMRDMYPTTPNWILAIMFDRSKQKVTRRALRLGLKKNQDVINSQISARAKGKDNSMEKNPRWKGGRSIDREGYVMIRVNGKAVREHRHIMEQMICRKLRPDEVVHHRNHNRSDNRESNLELLKFSEHGRIHSDISIKNLKNTPSHRGVV